jgi:hypothetical protein
MGRLFINAIKMRKNIFLNVSDKLSYYDGEGAAKCGLSSILIFLLIRNRPNKLECYITPGWEGFPGRNTLAYSAHLQLTEKIKCRVCSP